MTHGPAFACAANWLGRSRCGPGARLSRQLRPFRVKAFCLCRRSQAKTTQTRRRCARELPRAWGTGSHARCRRRRAPMAESRQPIAAAYAPLAIPSTTSCEAGSGHHPKASLRWLQAGAGVGDRSRAAHGHVLGRGEASECLMVTRIVCAAPVDTLVDQPRRHGGRS